MSPHKNNDNTQVWIMLIARFSVPIMVVLGVTLICIKDCADTTDPIDNAWKKVEHLCNLIQLLQYHPHSYFLLQVSGFLKLEKNKQSYLTL